MRSPLSTGPSRRGFGRSRAQISSCHLLIGASVRSPRDDGLQKNQKSQKNQKNRAGFYIPKSEKSEKSEKLEESEKHARTTIRKIRRVRRVRKVRKVRKIRKIRKRILHSSQDHGLCIAIVEVKLQAKVSEVLVGSALLLCFSDSSGSSDSSDSSDFLTFLTFLTFCFLIDLIWVSVLCFSVFSGFSGFRKIRKTEHDICCTHHQVGLLAVLGCHSCKPGRRHLNRRMHRLQAGPPPPQALRRRLHRPQAGPPARQAPRWRLGRPPAARGQHRTLHVDAAKAPTGVSCLCDFFFGGIKHHYATQKSPEGRFALRTDASLNMWNCSGIC